MFVVVVVVAIVVAMNMCVSMLRTDGVAYSMSSQQQRLNAGCQFTQTCDLRIHHQYVYIFIYICVYIFIYIHIYRTSFTTKTYNE